MKREALKRLVVTIVVSAAVSYFVAHAIAVLPTAQASADEAPHATGAGGTPATEAPRPSRIEGYGDPSEIRETHSDGGYQEWLEREASLPATNSSRKQKGRP